MRPSIRRRRQPLTNHTDRRARHFSSGPQHPGVVRSDRRRARSEQGDRQPRLRCDITYDDNDGVAGRCAGSPGAFHDQVSRCLQQRGERTHHECHKDHRGGRPVKGKLRRRRQERTRRSRSKSSRRESPRCRVDRTSRRRTRRMGSARSNLVPGRRRRGLTGTPLTVGFPTSRSRSIRFRGSDDRDQLTLSTSCCAA